MEPIREHREKDTKRIKICINSKTATSYSQEFKEFTLIISIKKIIKKKPGFTEIAAVPLFICTFMTEISQFNKAQFHFKSTPSGIYGYYVQHTSYSTQTPQQCTFV